MKKFSIYKRKDGRFEGRYNFYKDGAVIKKYFYGKTREDVELKLKQYIKSIVEAEKVCLRRFNSTVTEMAIEFLEVKTAELRPNTIGQYRMNIYKHIIPIVGKYKIYEIDDTIREKFSKYLDGLKKPLAKRTKNDLKRLLENIIEYAMVIARIRIQEEESDIRHLEKTDIRKIFNCFKQDVSTLMVFIVLYTGIRVGELCGLKWSNINFETESITVNRTVQRVFCGYTDEGTTTKVLELPIKERIIPIPEPLIEILKMYKGNESAYIMTGTCEKTEPRTLQYRLVTFAKNVGVSKMDFSALRDTFAINCLNRGISPKYLSSIMGINYETLAKYIAISSPEEDVRIVLDCLY